jgi:hypothetical protein
VVCHLFDDVPEVEHKDEDPLVTVEDSKAE